MDNINNKVRTYQIKLTTKSPVFIGDGKQLYKKEYSIKGNTVSVFDMKMLYSGLSKLNLIDIYEDYILDSGNKDDLGRWLESNGVPFSQYKNWIAYSFSCDFEGQNRNRTEISTFIKDKYGCPYIPGSSLKGMLRTILLSYLVSKEDSKQFQKEERDLQQAIDEERRSKRINRNRYLTRETKALEVKGYHTLKKLDEKPRDKGNAVNDFMSECIISDSKPLSTDDLILCQKIDMHQNFALRPLPIARECIKPEVEVVFDLTLNERFPFTIDEIKAAIKNFATLYYRNNIKKFQNQKKEIATPKVNNVWLGGGVGYISKTITYPLFGSQKGLENTAEILMKTVSDPRHGHNMDVRKGASPHVLKCTRYEKKLYEFGKCAINFE